MVEEVFSGEDGVDEWERGGGGRGGAGRGGGIGQHEGGLVVRHGGGVRVRGDVERSL